MSTWRSDVATPHSPAPEFSTHSQPAAISCVDLSLQLAGLLVLSDVTLDIPAKRTLALVGPNGAGKTSLLNCINGVYAPSSGRVTILGRDTTRHRPHRIAALGVARTFQNGPARTDMTVLDLALLGRHTSMRHRVFSYAVGLTALRRVERAQRQVAEETLELLGIADSAHHYIADLSFGAAKLADLARALCAEPKVLLLDEPVSGLDSGGRTQMVDTIRRITGERQVTTVVVEHDMGVVRRLADRIAVLAEGQVLRVGAPDDVLSDPEVARVFLGDEGRRDGTPPAG